MFQTSFISRGISKITFSFSIFFAIFVLVGHIIMLVVLFQNTGQPGHALSF